MKTRVFPLLLLLCLIFQPLIKSHAQEKIPQKVPYQSFKSTPLQQQLTEYLQQHPEIAQLKGFSSTGSTAQTLAAAEDGVWSDRFSLSGTDGVIYSVVEAEGKLFAAGIFSTIGKTVAANIAVWDGNAWYPLGSGTNGSITALAWHQGSLYVGGNFTHAGGQEAYGIARWKDNQWSRVSGNDEGKGLGGSGFVQEIQVDETNDLVYIGGHFPNVDGVPGTSNLAVWNGTGWGSVGNGTDGSVFAMLFHEDKLFIGGLFEHAGSSPNGGAAYFSEGQWHPMGTGAEPERGFIMDFAPAEDGGSSIVVAGGFTAIDGQMFNGIARYNISTNSWSPLGEGGEGGVFSQGEPGEVKKVKVAAGAVYLGGNFDTAGGAKANGIAVYSREHGFMPVGKGVSQNVFDLLPRENEILLFGGFKTANHGLFGESGLNPGDTLAYGMARASFNPHNPNLGVIWRTFSGHPFHGADGGISQILVHKGDLYVAGEFQVIGHSRCKSIARWDGAEWVPLGPGIGGFVNDLVAIGDDLYAGGYFAVNGPDGTQSSLVARWDGEQWHALGLGVGGYVNSQVFDLETDGTNLYVAGILLSQAGNPDGSIVDIANIAKWNGTSWSSVGEGLDLDGRVSALQMHQGNLYAGGIINVSGSQTGLGNLAKWDGTRWSSAGQFNNRTLAMLSDGTDLYAGGFFTEVDGNPASMLVKTGGNGKWEEVGGGVRGNQGSGVASLYMHNGMLFVGGRFNQAGSLAGANSIAYLKEGQWKTLGSGVSSSGGVVAVQVFDERLFLGGSFRTAGGKPSHHIAAWQHPGIITAVPVGTAEKPRKILVYPNPAAHAVTVAGHEAGITGFVLRDLSGKVVLQQQFPASAERQIQLGSLATGLYLTEIRTVRGPQFGKLVVN